MRIVLLSLAIAPSLPLLACSSDPFTGFDTDLAADGAIPSAGALGAGGAGATGSGPRGRGGDAVGGVGAASAGGGALSDGGRHATGADGGSVACGVDGRCGVEEAAKDGGMPHPDGAPATADGTLEGGTIVLTDASADATLGCTATFYRDADDDGFGDADQSILACAAPAGYVEDATDCYDGNAAAKPGQTEYFTADRGDGSFDYDCIDGPTPEYEGTAACSAFPSCAATPGWTDGDPGCGNTASWLLSCSGLTVVCGQSAESRTQACH